MNRILSSLTRCEYYVLQACATLSPEKFEKFMSEPDRFYALGTKKEALRLVKTRKLIFKDNHAYRTTKLVSEELTFRLTTNMKESDYNSYATTQLLRSIKA